MDQVMQLRHAEGKFVGNGLGNRQNRRRADNADLLSGKDTLADEKVA